MDIKYEIIDEIGVVLSKNANGSKEINVILWNEASWC